jgi:hypothetical protein
MRWAGVKNVFVNKDPALKRNMARHNKTAKPCLHPTAQKSVLRDLSAQSLTIPPKLP